MKASRQWLQKFFDKPLPDASALADALTFHAFEIESADGDILDVKVTPNRGADCLSHRGIAKEVSAILDIPMKSDTLAMRLNLIPKSEVVAVSIESPALCSRYMAAYIRDVKVGPSPAWLSDHLKSIGQKSINNVVDAANYVMFNIGQPMHVFDATKLASKSGQWTVDSGQLKIQIRNAKKGERIATLDGNEFALQESMLVIADGNANMPIAIAGVKGGKSAEVTPGTTDIILEAANFNGVSVRKTAQALKLRTDASSRFEQRISPELAGFGMCDCVDLILRVAGGELEGVVDEYPVPQKKKTVTVSLSQINAILGAAFSGSDVTGVFRRLGFQYRSYGTPSDRFEIEVPFERLDISIPEDMAEEIGRVIGYDKIPQTELPPLPAFAEVNRDFYVAENVREKLISLGYSEAYSSVFSDKGERQVANKVGGERPYLRFDLLEGLDSAVKKNVLNKDILGIKEVKLFEIGTVWNASREEVAVGIAGENEKAAQAPLGEYAREFPEAEHYGDYPVSALERYKPFSRFPAVIRDIALWVPSQTGEIEVERVIEQNAGDLLLRIELFDRFEKAGKLSYAFRLVFQSFDHTLTDEEANLIMENVYKAVKKEGWEVR